MSQKPMKRYTVGEEVFNSVSHGVGALLSVIGASVLVTLAACFGDLTTVLSSIIYGVSMVILYTMSTLYHAFPFEKVKKVFRIFDHTSIFILIAGTYTPFCLLALRGNPKGVWVFAVVWICAIAGVVMNAVSLEKTEKLSLVLYVVMGWAVVVVIKDIVAALQDLLSGCCWPVALPTQGGLSSTSSSTNICTASGICLYLQAHCCTICA